jgi:hypothetical protein
MKKSLYFFFSFLVFNMASAQQEISTAYATQATNMFAPLDKNRIPHKVLLDYGFEYTNLKAFNGTLTDSTVVDVPTLKHIYNTLFSSRVTSATTGFINPNNFESNWKTNRIAGTITVSGLYYKYNAFINDAINLGKVNFVNNQFQDKFVSGVWQNPYQEFQAFAMAPAITKYEGLSFKVKIPSTIFYSNYQSLVQSIQIDFGNGAGYVTVPFNQNITVNYATEGVKTWKYKLNLTNGTSLLSQSKIDVTQGVTTIPWGTSIASASNLSATSVASSTIYSHNITATKNYNGFGTVKLTIDDTNNDGIRKPLIVAEGFDAGIILAPERINGMNTYSQFRTESFNGGTELRSLIYNSNKQYDIIYVDWNNGVDFLQKNAFALEAVIAWVNSVKIGTEKNVILGQSMGGVVARYALADMEQSSLDHKTRLFVSHDAPQQGANIPVSVQYMFRHVTNLFNRYSAPYGTQVIDVPFLENSILDQPATKQMLMNWVNGFSNIDNTISSGFYTELKGKGINPTVNFGYPVNCRNIALSNGAECGITQGFNAGDDLLSYNLSGKLPFLQNLLVPLAGFLGYTAYQDPNILAIGFVGLLPGSSRYNVEFNAKSIPYGTGNQIYKGRISYTKKLFKIFGWAPTITVNITNAQKAQPTGVLPIDHYAGGRYDTTLFTAGATLPAGIYIRDRFNFIPTTSALDIGKGNVSLNDTDYKMAYVGATPPVAPKNSPFSNFSTDFEKSNPNASNKTHISFNSRNGEWLAKELNIAPITTNCSFMCASTQITGGNLLCTSATYSAPIGGTFNNWNITQGASLVTLTGNGTPNVILTALPNATGQVTLSLSMGDNNAKCGNIILTKTIWVGKPNVNLVEEPVVSSWDLTLTDPTNNNFSTQGITSITWTKLSGNGVLSGNGYYAGVDGSPTRAWTITIKISITNSCGTTEIIRTYDNPDGDHDPHTERMANPNTNYYTIYPNPSNDIVNIEIRDANNLPEKGATISGELFDMIGQSKSKVEINNNKATFSVRGLNKGIYVLKIYINNQVESHQIAVE